MNPSPRTVVVERHWREQRACQHDMRFVCLETANGAEQVRWGCVLCGWRETRNFAFHEHPQRRTYPLIVTTIRDPYEPPKWEYEAYLASDAWQERRHAAIMRCGQRCQLCGATNTRFEVHHNTYRRLGSELETDLTVLCGTCHEVFHDRALLADERRGEAA